MKREVSVSDNKIHYTLYEILHYVRTPISNAHNCFKVNKLFRTIKAKISREVEYHFLKYLLSKLFIQND